MKFEDFINKGQVRKTSVDLNLVRSIKKNIMNDLKYLEEQKISIISARKIVVNYYDSLRSILEAIAICKGYKVYQHEAFLYFLKSIDENVYSIKFDRFRKIRNRINYYGEDISIEQAKAVSEDMKSMTYKLIDKYLNEV